MIKDNKTYNILVVEDNPGDFALVEDYLYDEIVAPNITQAKSFKEAVDHYLNSEKGFDVILLDLSLRDKNGDDLIMEMLKIAPACPIIILSGYADIDFSIKSITKGITDYLLKDELHANILYRSIVYAIERKKAIFALEESERRYSDLFYLSPQPMWVFNSETLRFVQVNKAAMQLYGYTKEEYLNMRLEDIKSDENILKVKELIKSRHNKEVVKRTAIHYKKSGEPIQVEMYSSLLTINNINHGLVIAVDVTEKNLHQHNIMKAIIKAQEEERYEIGGELHDNVCQILGASKLYLSMLKENLPKEKLEFYVECETNISSALNEIRNLSHRLAPAFFEDSTLEESFKKLFNTFKVNGSLEINLNFDEKVRQQHLSRELQLNLYRIMQEQFKNIIKYAKATVVEVDVILYNHKLKMRIADNGVGFKINARRGGIGLSNMKRRTELFSGVFVIESSPGKGCTLIVDIPLEDAQKLI